MNETMDDYSETMSESDNDYSETMSESDNDYNETMSDAQSTNEPFVDHIETIAFFNTLKDTIESFLEYSIYIKNNTPLKLDEQIKKFELYSNAFGEINKYYEDNGEILNVEEKIQDALDYLETSQKLALDIERIAEQYYPKINNESPVERPSKRKRGFDDDYTDVATKKACIKN